MKKFFKKIAVYCVTAYAKILYGKAFDAANLLDRKTSIRHYVITNPMKPGHLIVVSAKSFQKMRRHFYVPKGYFDRDVLKNQSWYYTPGKGLGMPTAEAEVRRLAFIRERLQKANLL